MFKAEVYGGLAGLIAIRGLRNVARSLADDTPVSPTILSFSSCPVTHSLLTA
jgi:hypothetical protein